VAAERPRRHEQDDEALLLRVIGHDPSPSPHPLLNELHKWVLLGIILLAVVVAWFLSDD
jgi:hypothetical protein